VGSAHGGREVARRWVADSAGRGRDGARGRLTDIESAVLARRTVRVDDPSGRAGLVPVAHDAASFAPGFPVGVAWR
jgi:hypothetical protein